MAGRAPWRRRVRGVVLAVHPDRLGAHPAARAANAEAPSRAREVRGAAPSVHPAEASLAPAVEVPGTAPRWVGGEHPLPTEALDSKVLGREELLMMWSNPGG